jgi:hypothetical protein
MADSFKALSGGEGVTGSTHSRGGIDGGAQRLESHLNGAWGGRPAVRTDGGSGSVSVEGRRKGEGAGGLTWAKRLSKAGQFQGKRVQATRRMQDEM